ncbi:MAG TPA: HEAT repeat domain-containing protein [Acidimicrobiales bacterium]|nr:HEAT repeat domain-containing protein [Acidimicrobiales bacterium]
MTSDETTIVEPFENELLRASFSNSAKSTALLMSTLESTVTRYRVLALRGLVRQSLMTTDVWQRALRDSDVDVRRDAIQQLAHDPQLDPAVLVEVNGLLGDDDALVVEGAAFALGEHLDVNAVEALCVVATTHDDARCRESAIAALGAIGDDRARSTIIASLKDKPPIRRRAIVALANFEGPDIDAALDDAGEDRDWQVRSAVSQLRSTED